MTGFLVVNLTGAVAVETAQLETLDLIMRARGPEWIAILTDKTIYDAPIDTMEIFNGVQRLAAYRSLLTIGRA